jgi:OOP family OmpA-OmpF porin
MKFQVPTFKQGLTMTSIALLSILVSCAHKMNPVKISSSANPAEEIKAQTALVQESYAKQVDVLASDDFEKSMDYFSQAKNENKKGAANKEILESVGYARAYLSRANQEAELNRNKSVEISSARESALRAGARSHSDKLNEIDEKFSNLTSSNDAITAEDKAKLQNEYLALELYSIKYTNLNVIKKTLKNAEDKNAEKIIPKVYAIAQQKYNAAEKLIETDRHSMMQINSAVAEAKVATDRVMTLLASEKTSRNQTPEQRAITLEGKDLTIKQTDEEIVQIEAESAKKDEVLAQQGETLLVAETQNDELKKKQQDEKVVADAAARFKNNEADVYRQDGLLIIRLKSMNFSSGRSELPSESIAVLNKVKDVIKNLGPGDVSVEGHTDAVGAATANQKLSEKRAQSVMQFFTADEILSDNKMNFVGHGYSKPLSTNKTKEGRAQNRRVDIVIKTNHVI